MEAEQVGHERGEAGRAREADAEVQAGAAVVVPRAAAGQRGGVAAHVLGLEGGGAAAVVGDALRLRARLRRHAPHRHHPGHHQPGTQLTFGCIELSALTSEIYCPLAVRPIYVP